MPAETDIGKMAAGNNARIGATLVQATKPFAVEDRFRSWRLLITTVLIWASFLVSVVLVPYWPGKIILGGMAGLIQVRLFIFYHDYLHHAIFRKSKVAGFIMTLVGWHVMAVRSVWKETHDYHHKHNSKLIGSSIGSFPIISLGMWRGISTRNRRIYRVLRHPVTIFFGYGPLFLYGMCVSPFRRNKKRHWGGPVAIAVHYGLLALSAYLFGWVNGLCTIVIPVAVTTGLGSYLFYVQHNFPDMKLRNRREWEYTEAALQASSMFEMNRIMHWFTGNIGYHHVHHLNHRIPFYRLPEAMKAIPELQTPGTTTWHPKDIKACLDLAVWDPEQERMLTYQEVR